MTFKDFGAKQTSQQPFSIKTHVALVDVANHYLKLEKKGDKYWGLCPFHSDGNPSFWVYPDTNRYFCFGCQADGDAADLIQHFEGVDFAGALKIMADLGLITPTAIAPTPPQKSYKGPVRPETVGSWHLALKLLAQKGPSAKDWLHKRLINDKTIDAHQLGWAMSKQAITIPFWTGVPGASEAEVIQLRSLGAEGRYFGLKGHYRKALLSRHLLAETTWAVVLMGTFDALLAAQDGLPAVSANGCNSFAPEWAEWFSHLQDIVVVPDRDNVNELEAARKIVSILGPKARLVEFPKGEWGKDYTDLRVAGYTAAQAKYLFTGDTF